MKKENTSIEVRLPDGVTQEQIDAWKDRYGERKVKRASLPRDEDCSDYLEVIVRVPGSKERSEFEKWIDKNPDKAKQILVNSCLLSHKEEVKPNEYLFLGAADAIAGLLPTPKAIIKNL